MLTIRTTAKSAAAAAAALLMLTSAACTDPNSNAATPATAQPTQTTTPSCDPGTTPCTQEKATEQAETKRLQEEATQAYRATFTERMNLGRQGGTDEPTPQLSRFAQDEYLEMAMATLREQKRLGIKAAGNPTTDVTVEPGQQRGASDPRLTMSVCESQQDVTLTRDGQDFKGTSSKGLIFASLVDGHPKITGAEMAEVESCGA